MGDPEKKKKKTEDFLASERENGKRKEKKH